MPGGCRVVKNLPDRGRKTVFTVRRVAQGLRDRVGFVKGEPANNTVGIIGILTDDSDCLRSQLVCQGMKRVAANGNARLRAKNQEFPIDVIVFSRFFKPAQELSADHGNFQKTLRMMFDHVPGIPAEMGPDRLCLHFSDPALQSHKIGYRFRFSRRRYFLAECDFKLLSAGFPVKLPVPGQLYSQVFLIRQHGSYGREFLLCFMILVPEHAKAPVF